MRVHAMPSSFFLQLKFGSFFFTFLFNFSLFFPYFSTFMASTCFLCFFFSFNYSRIVLAVGGVALQNQPLFLLCKTNAFFNCSSPFHFFSSLCFSSNEITSFPLCSWLCDHSACGRTDNKICDDCDCFSNTFNKFFIVNFFLLVFFLNAFQQLSYFFCSRYHSTFKDT